VKRAFFQELRVTDDRTGVIETEANNIFMLSEGLKGVNSIVKFKMGEVFQRKGRVERDPTPLKVGSQ